MFERLARYNDVSFGNTGGGGLAGHGRLDAQSPLFVSYAQLSPESDRLAEHFYNELRDYPQALIALPLGCCPCPTLNGNGAEKNGTHLACVIESHCRKQFVSIVPVLVGEAERQYFRHRSTRAPCPPRRPGLAWGGLVEQEHPLRGKI
jgi:hypothetical protein